MNKYEFICKYCNYSWEVNYIPQQDIYCAVCNDKNIRVRDVSERVDAYKGCPPFPEDDSFDAWELMGD